MTHARLPCPSLCPEFAQTLSIESWYPPIISSSVAPFSSCFQSFPAAGSFPMSWFFASGGQSVEPSVSDQSFQWMVSVDLLRIDKFYLLAVQGTFQSLLQHHSLKALILWLSAFFMVQPLHTYLTTGKTITLIIWTSGGKVISLLFYMLSRFVTAFLPRSKSLLILWLESPSTVILEPKKMKSVTVSTFSPSTCHKVMGLDAMILVFWMLSFKPAFSLSSFLFIKRLFSSSSLSAIKVVSSVYLRLLIFLPAILIPACESSSSGFFRMYYAYKLNKQGDNIQPWCTPFPILSQCVLPCLVLTVASCPAYRFLRKQVRWSGIPISLRIFHSLLWSTQSKALA